MTDTKKPRRLFGGAFFLPLSHKGRGEDLAGNQHASDNLGIDENPMLAESKRPGKLPGLMKMKERGAYRGRVVAPIRCWSIEAAHWRPSRIAHTTSDCPRRMSPEVNTFGTEV